MTKEELIRRLKELHGDGDWESAHGEADSLLISFINDPEVEAAYDGVGKWYA